MVHRLPSFPRLELQLPSATQETPSSITHIPLPYLVPFIVPQLLRRSFRPCCLGIGKQRYINQLKLRWIISNPKFRNKTRLSRVMSNSNSPLPPTNNPRAIHYCSSIASWLFSDLYETVRCKLNCGNNFIKSLLLWQISLEKWTRKECSTVPSIWILYIQPTGFGSRKLSFVTKWKWKWTAAGAMDGKVFKAGKYIKEIFSVGGLLLIGKYQSKSTQ